MGLFDKVSNLNDARKKKQAELDAETISTAAQAEKDASIQAGLQAAFPMLNVAVDHILAELTSHGFANSAESTAMALMIAACGLCKHGHYDLATAAKAFGQAWGLAELPKNAPIDADANADAPTNASRDVDANGDIHGGTANATATPENQD